MTFALEVDALRWRAGLDAVLEREPRTVPVLKGNGYGFGNDALAREAARMGCDTIAVGTAVEAVVVARSVASTTFTGDVLVLTPWHPSYDAADRIGDETTSRRTIRTLSHPEAILELAQREPGARVVVEVLTSMRRHGVTPRDLGLLMRPLESLEVEGFALHLPLDRQHRDDAVAEVDHWAGILADAGLRPRTLWVSHMSDHELAQVRASLPGSDIRPRIGTSLWLGERTTFKASATLLDVHTVQRGDRLGYRQRRASRDGQVLVVSAGTAHGVGLEAPPSGRGIKDRGKVAARGGLQAMGWSASPFTLDGRRLRFVEPPHMQASMLWLPAEEPAPPIGSPIACRVRMTTSNFDVVRGL